jgi:hypothetical protein
MQQTPGAPVKPVSGAASNPARGVPEGYTVTIRQPLEKAGSAVVEIGFTAGQLLIDALPESSDLIKGEIELREGEKADPVFKLEDDVAHFTLRSADPVIIPTLGQWDDLGATWELNLNRDVPTALSVSTGAGKSLLDLSRLNLTALKVEAGVGSTEIFIPRQGRVEAEIDSGVGELIITIPTDVAARIEIDGGLSSINVSGKDYRHDGDLYVSPDFESATDRVDMRVNAGLGSIVIR